MAKEQDKKLLESTLTNRSLVVNEGVFLLRISRADVNHMDFVKQCLYGDSFPSAYSPHLSMIPVGMFLPQIFGGKNIFMEHKINNTKVPMLDSFVQFAFLIHDEGHREVKSMYDKLYSSTERSSYSETYEKMKTSVLVHLSNEKRNVKVPNEKAMLDFEKEDVETKNYLKENSDKLTIVFFTQAASARLQENDPKRLKFGSLESQVHFVPITNTMVAKFDGYTTNQTCEVSLSEKLTSAIKRELLTLTQFFVGFDKCASENISDYIRNTNYLFNGQLNAIDCRNDDNVESYCLGALKLFISRNLELDEINTSSRILNDENYEETIRKKILFSLISLLEPGSCFNGRNLTKREIVEGKPSIVFATPYTNPFHELCGALYENVSWLTHVLTTCTFYSKVKAISCCESCDQKTCAINAPSMLFHMLTNRLVTKKDRSSAFCCFYTANNYNRTGPFGNLRNQDSQSTKDLNNSVIWEKHHRDLLTSLMDSYQLDMSLFGSDSPATEDDVDVRAEKIFEWICSQIDNIVDSCDQFCEQLNDGSETIQKVANVESEIRNVYRIPSLYDKGFVGILASEGLLFVLRCMLIFEQAPFQNKIVNDVFLRVQPLFLDNKSGFAVTKHNNVNLSIPKVAVKSYTSDDLTVDIQSKLSENYTIPELQTQISFKVKTYMFGRYDEKKGNGARKSAVMLQNMSQMKKGGSMSSMVMNNSFLHFKNFCSKQVCKILQIEENDFCRETVNDIKDEMLDKYAHLFKFVTQYAVEDWTTLIQLITVMKMLEYLNFQPSYNKVSFLTFNALEKDSRFNTYTFKSSLLGEEFNTYETLYGMNCHMVEFCAEISGTNIVFKKLSGKVLDQHNELINAFSKTKMHPGAPIYYLKLGEKSNRFKENTVDNMMTNFLNQEQYKLEKDAAYTNYIVSHRKQFYDCVFESTFADQGRYIENRYSSEVLEEMMSEFDDRYPVEMFSSQKVQEFMKLVLREYLNHDQSSVKTMMKRIKEIYAKVQMRKSRKRLRDDEESGVETNVMVNPSFDQGDEEDDAENQFLNKRVKLE